VEEVVRVGVEEVVRVGMEEVVRLGVEEVVGKENLKNEKFKKLILINDLQNLH
tara:strand:+ start:161 stop:319 length:159 start_codon:yes stop_codon:yes gene_type:complete